MKFPSYPQSGQPVEKDFRDLLNYVRASRLISVSGGKLKESPNGLTIEIPTSAKGANRYDVTNHPWKVTKSKLMSEDETPLRQWDYIGGDIWDNGTNYPIADGSVNIQYGYIYIEIQRDSSTREITSQQVLAALDLPTPSDDYTQIIAIAYVDDDSSKPPLQLKFEEIKLKELLLVENGEFKMGVFYMAHQNTYDPPSP